MKILKTSNIQHPTSNIQSSARSFIGRSMLDVGCWMFLTFLYLAFPFRVHAQSLTDAQLSDIRFDQKLNAQISLNLEFRDENGKTVALRDYFGAKPVVLVLGYYECPMLCTLTFNGMVEAANDMKWSIGKEFNVVHVSINPNETPALALAKKQTYVKRYGRAGAANGWHFLTGEERAIHQLAGEVGFGYAYDPSVHQYAHPSGLVILTPDGKVAKYLFGVKFAPSELYAALQGASQQKIGSPIERLVLLCFHYSPIKGKYGAAIMTGVRVLAVVTLIGMAWMFVAMIRRERGSARVPRAVFGVAPKTSLSHASDADVRNPLCETHREARETRALLGKTAPAESL